MKTEYFDSETGQLSGYTIDDKLFNASDVLVGEFNIENEIYDTFGSVSVVRFHDGLYTGPNRPPFALVKSALEDNK